MRRRVALGLVAFATLAGIAFWPFLPGAVAVHFGVTGQATTVVPKPVGVFVLPVTMAVTHVVLAAAYRADPPRDARAEFVTTVGTLAVLAGLQVYVLLWNVGVELPFVVVLGGFALWAVGTVGYVGVRMRG